MKKFMTFFIGAMLSVVSFAQTIEGTKFFDNTYVGLNAGAVSSMNFNDEFSESILPVAGIEVGKDVTPVLGFSVEGLTTFNTDKDLTTVNNLNVNGNMKVNLSNWIGGYNGAPRKFEVLFVPGIGWGHLYGEDVIDRNFAVYNTFMQFNFNLGEEKAWTINIKPGVVWNAYNNEAMFTKDNSNLRLTAGVTYRFKNKSNGKRYFAFCPYSVTQQAYDEVVAQNKEYAARINELENRKPVEKIVEVPVTQEKVVYVNNATATYITFPIGSSVLPTVEKDRAAAWAEAVKGNEAIVKVIGSADTKTGSENRNNTLAVERAEAVKNILENGVDEQRINTEVQLDAMPNSNEGSRAAVLETL